MARKKKRTAKKTRFNDGISTSVSGLGSSCDNTTSVMPGRLFPSSMFGNHLRTPFGQAYGQLDQYWFNMYQQYWEAKKIVNIPPGDMTREGWEYESNDTNPDDLEKIKKREEDLGIPQEVNKALIYERLYGGGLVFFGIKEDEGTPASEPIDPENLEENSISFVRAIPSFRVNSSQVETHPLSPNFHRPEYYIINDTPVHRSRFIVFDGCPIDQPHFSQLNFLSRNNNLGFGESVLLTLYSEIQDAQGARQSIAHLLHKLSVAIFKKKNVDMLRTSNQGNKVLDELEDITQMMSNFKGVILDHNDGIENYSSNANAGEGLMIAYLQVLSAASDIPATRFIGQAPGGLNATGDSDLRNYYDRISADQKNNLRLPLQKTGQMLAMDVLGKPIEDLTVEFNPLWQKSDKEAAEIRQMDANTINTLVTSSVMIEEDAQKELLERGVVLNELTPFEPPEEEPLDLGLGGLPGDIEPGKDDADIRPGSEQ